MSKKTNGAVAPIDAPTYERCKAHKKDGSRCKKAPILGGTVCRSHGGAAPQVKRSAQQRLAALRPLAVDVVERAMNGEDDSIALRAAVVTFDRTGMAANVKVDVDTFKPWQKALMKISGDAKKKRKGKKSKKSRRTIPGELADSRTDAPPKPEPRQPPFIPQHEPMLTPLQALEAGKVSLGARRAH